MSLLRRLSAGVIVARSATVPFERPDRIPRALLAMAPWGPSLAGGVAAAAARYPERVAVIDDDGATTYQELWTRAGSLAAGLVSRGVGPASRVGILCRNHRGFVEAITGAAATGAGIVLLNTGFAGPQLADVLDAEGIDAVLHDDEFSDIVANCNVRIRLDEAAMRALCDEGRRPKSTTKHGPIVILTSGTTGRPKGAARSSDPAAIEGVAAVLERIPFRFGDVQMIAAPLFHAWGLSNLLLGISRSATQVMSRRFEPLTTLRLLEKHRVRALVVVPVMLNRMVALPREQFRTLPDLQIIASSGSAIGSRVVTDVLDRFGPVLYNLYGSTEVAVATIATPADLQRSPGTAGRVAFGVQVEILDDHDEPVATGGTGRVFVGGSVRFDGYTNGTDKARVGDLISSGDLGHFEGELLFVEGRDDDMIVSGGENVFPSEVEELLAHHPAVAEVAVVGVPDAEFGQVLVAFVVRRAGAELDADDVRSHVRSQLARYKVPRRVEFVDALPRNETGKLVRSRLVADATER